MIIADNGKKIILEETKYFNPLKSFAFQSEKL